MLRQCVNGCLVGMMGLVVVACSSSAIDDELLEDVESFGQELRKPQGTNGDADYCNNPAALCVQGEGDCDSHAQCVTGLACVGNIGPNFFMPVGHDVCAPAHCSNNVIDGNETARDCGGSCSAAGFACPAACTVHVARYPLGNANHCSVECPCSATAGDCDSDSQCTAGLVCASNNGWKFGGPASDDYCVTPSCVNGIQDVGEIAADCGGGCGSCGQFLGLGELPGGAVASYAHAVNVDASVIVGKSISANGTEAFRWTLPTGMVALGDLPGGIFESTAYGINPTGSVIVGRGTTADGSAAVSWASSGAITALGDLPGGPVRSEAYGVSRNGAVIVGWSSAATGVEAFRHSGGVMTGLGDLVGGTFYSQAWAASSDGAVVVGRSRSANGTEAFRWTSSGMVGLGDLPGGTFNSLATAVNTTGSVIAGNASSAGGSEAFRWTSRGMTGLGFPAGTTSSFIYGMNDSGSHIVGTATDGTNNVAFVWTAAQGMRSLVDILTADGVDLTGWTLQLATAISADGTWVVGYGMNPSGNTEAFRARIP